ncbi:MAG TPA: Uma2 family endonuclease [Candidatus Limnocylindrales bacterium]|nr:Uma2 family endonuclease [Candidatus Limnocylindrales bacterium]
MQTDIAPRTMTAEQFEEFSLRPENADRRLELVEGEITEVVSNSYASEVAANILAEIRFFAKTHGGRVTGADGGYVVGNDRYIPDVAFISEFRQPERPNVAWNPIAPDLAVQVLSPTDDPTEIRIKTSNYLSAGTTVWVADPDRKRIEVHAPGIPVFIARMGDTLGGGDVLPGFTLAVGDIFPA